MLSRNRWERRRRSEISPHEKGQSLGVSLEIFCWCQATFRPPPEDVKELQVLERSLSGPLVSGEPI